MRKPSASSARTPSPLFTCPGKKSGKRHALPEPGVSMGLPGLSEYEIWRTDPEAVRAVRHLLRHRGILPLKKRVPLHPPRLLPSTREECPRAFFRIKKRVLLHPHDFLPSTREECPQRGILPHKKRVPLHPLFYASQHQKNAL